MIIVTGIGSCGSSMIAGILNILGVDMGKSLREPDFRNPWGYYEDTDFAELNKIQIDTPDTEYRFLWKLKELASRRVEPWGVKSPEISHLINFYRVAFPDARWIWVRRKYTSTVKSLKKNWGDQVPYIERLAEIRRGYLLRDLPGHARHMVYEDFQANPEKEIQMLASWANADPGRCSDAVAFVKSEEDKRNEALKKNSPTA